MDCRILPEVSVDLILNEIRNRCNDIEKKYRVTVTIEIKQRVESKSTSKEEPFVLYMRDVVKEMNKVDPVLVGIGGGTVGAHLRNLDIPTIVWATLEESAHQPNEYCVIKNMIGDAKIMARLMSPDL
jgi:succinyl-diaminopimelate desuccinylase